MDKITFDNGCDFDCFENKRCASYEARYGPPVQCDECKLRSAFDRRDENKKVRKTKIYETYEKKNKTN